MTEQWKQNQKKYLQCNKDSKELLSQAGNFYWSYSTRSYLSVVSEGSKWEYINFQKGNWNIVITFEICMGIRLKEIKIEKGKADCSIVQPIYLSSIANKFAICMGIKMNEQELKIPNHIAVILDGNGRWAKKKMMPRNYGHVQGSKNVEKICEDAYKLGVKYFTVYAFSTENWKRPEEEVNALMKLLRNYMKTCLKISSKNNMRVRVIGDITKLPEDFQNNILELEKRSAVNTGLNLQVALNYGGRDEIIRSIKKLMKDYDKKEFDINDIDGTMFERYLDTKDIPDPDLLIRTSGEQRLSNYLLWQLAYTEFYFTDVLWPDFTKDELVKAIEYYNGRDRRFGTV